MIYDLRIDNGMIATSRDTFKGTLYVNDGKIARIDIHGAEKDEANEVIDARGNYVLPGFIDPHTHLNDPGLTESEDFYTGTCSAAAGGITTVLEHPLTFPLPSNKKNLQDKRDIAASKAVVDFALWGALTPDNYGDVQEMIDLGAIAFKAFMPYSVEIPQINDGALLKHMHQLSGENILFGIHCENDAIVRNCTDAAVENGTTAIVDYELGRPEIAEIEAVNRVALLAKETGCKTHVVHCSSDTAVEIVKHFRNNKTDISVETCPHYLKLSRNNLKDLGTFGICNPPLRSEEKREALLKRLVDGDIDFIGSDHATYTFEEKELKSNNVFDVPAGLTGIQTCFPLVYDLVVSTGLISINRFVQLTSSNVAKRFNIYPKKGEILVGADADIVIFNGQSTWKVVPEVLHYKMKWSPYMDMGIKGEVVQTIVRGSLVFDHGKIVAKAGYGDFVTPNKKVER